MGDEAGELDSFVRFLVMRLLNSLKGKALNYTKDGRDDGQARSNLFMLNNSFYLLEELGPNANTGPRDDEFYRIDNSWFVDKINKLMDSEKVGNPFCRPVANTTLPKSLMIICFVSAGQILGTLGSSQYASDLGGRAGVSKERLERHFI